jgi:putative MFS transporter
LKVLQNRRNTMAFWVGCVLVTIGVMLHLPMFVMARNSGFVLAHMPMDAGMLLGMAAIVCGYGFAGFGLLPRASTGSNAEILEPLAPAEETSLKQPHWVVAASLSLALVIDIMKPASLGFVLPGMRIEYAVGKSTVAWLPFAALVGTVVGSFLWGLLADLYGRRATILLSAVMFVGTSICGAMPNFWWNVGMCFLMGAAAGGMLPVAYALLAEIMPTRHRGWCLVLVGGIGAVGGYFAASALSALLQPFFGWRIMWFLNLPTGLLLIALSPLLPESARFLQQMGRLEEARLVLARFGVVLKPASAPTSIKPGPSTLPAADRRYVGATVALTMAALAWGLVNFGLLLWLPAELLAEGRSVATASALIAMASLIAVPTVAACAWLFSTWSTKWTLALMIGTMLAGMIGLAYEQISTGGLTSPTIPLSVLIVGSSGVIATLLPYAAENYPLRIRGRATGWIAGCSKLGGLLAQGWSIAAAPPTFKVAMIAIATPAVIAAALVAVFCRESRGRDLRELDALDAAARGPPRRPLIPVSSSLPVDM